MPVYKYAVSYLTDFYYVENGKIYRVSENRTKVELTQEQFAQAAAACRENGNDYKVIHDYEVFFLMDLWDEKPSLIDKEQLEFYYEYGLISEAEYEHYDALHRSLTEGRDP